jgi:glucose/arabinose dehydrogenase
MTRSMLLLCGLLSLGACGDDDDQPADAGGTTSDDGGGGAGGDDGGTQPTRRCQAPSKADSPGNTCPSASPARLKATRIAQGFEIPVLVTYAPNDPEKRLFVVERTGQIRIIKDGAALPEPFLELNVSGGSSQNAEQGLLGLAFDPEYETNGRFYINYTGSNAMNEAKTFVVSYAVSSDPDKADTSTKRPIVDYDDLESNHNGGMLAFGPDGCLYIASGDGGGGNDPSGSHGPIGSGQALDTPLGKLLRLDVDHPMERAPGNLTTSGAIPHIWDYGLRNPWRFSFDRETGDL